LQSVNESDIRGQFQQHFSTATFAHADPKSTKRHWLLDCLFALLGSVHVKAACKHVGEIDTLMFQYGVVATTTTTTATTFLQQRQLLMTDMR